MKITEDSINHNAVRLIKELVDTRYDMIAGDKDMAMTAERGFVLMTLGEIGGALALAEELKKVLKA